MHSKNQANEEPAENDIPSIAQLHGLPPSGLNRQQRRAAKSGGIVKKAISQQNSILRQRVRALKTQVLHAEKVIDILGEIIQERLPEEVREQIKAKLNGLVETSDAG